MPTQPDVDLELGQHLDRGESQDIRLALDLRLPLLIEEQAGRNVAREVGLKISGIAGQALRGIRLNVLSSAEAKEVLIQLKAAERIHRRVHEAVRGAIDDEA